MSGPSHKAAELGKTQTQKIGDIQAELLLLLNQKTTEVKKMKKAFLAQNGEDISIAEMIIPPEFVEQAAKDKKRRRTTAKLIGLTYFSFKLQNYVLSDIDNLLSQQVKTNMGEKHGSCKFSSAERLEGWRIERTMRITGNCDMHYYHLQSGKYFRAVSEVMDFLLYEKYPKTGKKRKDKEIVEEESDVGNMLNISSQITEDSYNEILQAEDLYAIYLDFVYSGSKNIGCQPVGQTSEFLLNDQNQETCNREKNMGNEEKMNFHLFGLENINCQPTDIVGDVLLNDQFPENHNGEKSNGNEEKREMIDLLSDVNNEEEDNMRKRIKTTDLIDVLNDEKFWVEMRSVMLEDYPIEKQDPMKTNSGQNEVVPPNESTTSFGD